MKKNVCVLCGEKFEGFGNNPVPVAQDGRCCDMCDENKVIVKRLDNLSKGLYPYTGNPIPAR